MKVNLWVAIDNFGRMYYSGNKDDAKRFIENFEHQKLKLVLLKGEVKNV